MEQKTEQKNISKNTPEARINAGAITATIWKNVDKEENTFNTITFDRRYKDKDDNWKSTNSLRFNDLPKAALVLNKAYEYLALKGRSVEEVY